MQKSYGVKPRTLYTSFLASNLERTGTSQLIRDSRGASTSASCCTGTSGAIICWANICSAVIGSTITGSGVVGSAWDCGGRGDSAFSGS